MTKEQKLLAKAKAIAAEVETWADFSNALYNPHDGILAVAYRSRPARQKFMKSPEYKKIEDLMEQTIERFGLVEGGNPKKSGKFVVRVPQSLHAALEREAAREGVSLNQLVMCKLATQLNTACGL